MLKILTFRDASEEHIISKMMQYNSKNIIALKLNQDTQLKTGSEIKIDLLDEPGFVIEKRRRLFFFWLYEYLVQQECKYGKVYSWYKKSQIQFQGDHR